MKERANRLLSGSHAVCEGAVEAGCRFFAGYPISPSTDILEWFAERSPLFGGRFLQMEDEIAAFMAVQGASCGGVLSMTATSGPGFSLMMESIGFAAASETPCVIVNVQRGGPSTGLPGGSTSGDVLQARFGSHGDYNIAVFIPSSVEECYSLTLKAFETAVKFRTPVILLLEQSLACQAELVDRPPLKWNSKIVRSVVQSRSEGHQRITGLCQDTKGVPTTSAKAYRTWLARLAKKWVNFDASGQFFEANHTKDAKLVIVAYGTAANIVESAVSQLRKKGHRVGWIKLTAIWPFPEKAIKKTIAKTSQVLTVEMNCGQLRFFIERAVGETSRCFFLGLNEANSITCETVMAVAQRALLGQKSHE